MDSHRLKLFINYRRSDHPDFVEHIRTWFMLRYGRENVCMDFDSIPPFARFEDFIREKIRESDAVVVIIGPRWLELMLEKQQEQKPDYVRIELEEALKHGKLIAPLAIQGATVPTEDELPDKLRPILQYHIPELRSGRDILQNIEWIMDNIERSLQQSGVAYELAPPTQPLIKAHEAVEAHTIRQALNTFYEARNAEDWLSALGWLAKIEEFGAEVPAFFRLDEKRQEIQARLAEEEAQRRRLEVAAYNYEFARMLMKYNEPVAEIEAALEETWRVLDGYDPDNLVYQLNKSRRGLQSPLSEGHEVPVAEILMPFPPFEWTSIPAGPLYSSDPSKAQEIPAFRISTYPITVAQYSSFINEDGYREARWWTANGWRWRQENNISLPRFWDDKNYQHFFEPDHPIVGVSWYEAIAFCHWLQARANRVISLATDQQWQRAAVGDQNWRYPWGDAFSRRRCNTKEGGINFTVSVQSHKSGQSFFRVWDMIGNTREWTLTVFFPRSSTNLDSEGTRILKGAAWADNGAECSVSSVKDSFPYTRHISVGFRIVSTA